MALDLVLVSDFAKGDVVLLFLLSWRAATIRQIEKELRERGMQMDFSRIARTIKSLEASELIEDCGLVGTRTKTAVQWRLTQAGHDVADLFRDRTQSLLNEPWVE